MVWLNTKNLITKRPNCKLENFHYRKYAIKKIINLYTIKLELISKLQMHSVFFINLFISAATNPLYPGHMQLFGCFIEVNKKIKYKVLEIIDFCFFKKTKKFQYCIC